MARPRATQPAYAYHVSGQARVQIDGQSFYLGPHGTPESLARYYALLSEYNANGQRLPVGTETHQADQPITVRCITAEFREHIKVKYLSSAAQTCRFKNLCTLLEDEYGDDPATTFGPRKLTQLRDLFVASGNCRKYANTQTRNVVLIFKYGVSRELVTPERLVALESIEPLRPGQTTARESAPKKTIDVETVRLTATQLSPVLRAMIGVQVSTGMRPSEVCSMRPCDIEKRKDGVWLYRPAKHKTQHYGKAKVVPLVGDAKIALKPFLDRATEAFCFSPQESAQWYRDQRTERRKTPVR